MIAISMCNVASSLGEQWRFQLVYYISNLMHAVAGGCTFLITEQPIASAECLLYEADEIILMCTIISQGIFGSKIPLDSSRINIKWYHNNGTESELTVGTNETRREGGNGDPIRISSTLAISLIRQHDANTLAQGSYYCRVSIAGWPSGVSNSSQRFTVLHKDDYLQYGSSCSGQTFIDRDVNTTCIVHSVVEISLLQQQQRKYWEPNNKLFRISNANVTSP